MQTSARLIPAAVVAMAGIAHGSSHSDAPLIKQDPQANLTDVYAFVGTKYDDPSVPVLNVLAAVRPFSEPGDGPHYDRFADDALYSLHVTDPATGETVLRYDFRFSAVGLEGYQNPGTILSYGLGLEVGPIMEIGDARQNYVQTYTVERTAAAGPEVIGEGLPVPPYNAGGRVTPLYNDENGAAVSGAASLEELDAYTRQAIREVPSGEVFFAGAREDGFYADVPGVFDLLNARILDNNGTLADGLGQDSSGTDGFSGFNVLTYGVQIPLEDLPEFQYTDAFFGPQSGVGVYASVSRPFVTKRGSGNEIKAVGEFVQVNRLGNPLFNEVLVALSDKDFYNASSPVKDSNFATFARNPEVAVLINTVFGTDFQATGRDDLVAVFIPDVLRVATTTGPVPLSGEEGFSRLGFIGGDTTGGVSSGWPNGRRFGDDVVDIALTAVASGPTYEQITIVGDNVPANDVLYNRVFPYAGTPNSGSNNTKDAPAPASGASAARSADFNSDGVVDFADVADFVAAFREASR